MTKTLAYVETEGGPFILLPERVAEHWRGAPVDYPRACAFEGVVGVVDVGGAQALVLGRAEVTAWSPLVDGGVFVQRIFGDDARIRAIVDDQASLPWASTSAPLTVGAGGLQLFDSALVRSSVDDDGRLPVELAPGIYEVNQVTCRPDPKVDIELVRLRRLWLPAGERPFVFLPAELASGWKGCNGSDVDAEISDLDRADPIGEGVGVLAVPGAQALVLGCAAATTWVPFDDGGVLVQRREGAVAAVEAALFQIAALSFTAVPGTLRATTALVGFDAALEISEPAGAQKLTVPLVAGDYAVAIAERQADGVDLGLIRLRAI